LGNFLCIILDFLPNKYLTLVDRRSTNMPDNVNGQRTKHNQRSHTYLTGLLLFGILGLGALSIGGCDSSTPPAETLAENEEAFQ
jgi:hypothetical protein